MKLLTVLSLLMALSAPAIAEMVSSKGNKPVCGKMRGDSAFSSTPSSDRTKTSTLGAAK